jgi:hypothetical protein
VKQPTFIKLRRAYVPGIKRKLKLTLRVRGGRDYNAWVHVVPESCRIFRVATDIIVVTDGGNGYMAFQLSELQEMLREARDLPIVTEVKL